MAQPTGNAYKTDKALTTADGRVIANTPAQPVILENTNLLQEGGEVEAPEVVLLLQRLVEQNDLIIELLQVIAG